MKHATHAPPPIKPRARRFDPRPQSLLAHIRAIQDFSGDPHMTDVTYVAYVRDEPGVTLRLGEEGPMCEVRHYEQAQVRKPSREEHDTVPLPTISKSAKAKLRKRMNESADTVTRYKVTVAIPIQAGIVWAKRQIAMEK